MSHYVQRLQWLIMFYLSRSLTNWAYANIRFYFQISETQSELLASLLYHFGEYDVLLYLARWWSSTVYKKAAQTSIYIRPSVWSFLYKIWFSEGSYVSTFCNIQVCQVYKVKSYA